MRGALASLALIALMTGCAVPRWPVEAAVTSPFGLRMRGIRPDLHRGVDLGVPSGTEVRSMNSRSCSDTRPRASPIRKSATLRSSPANRATKLVASTASWSDTPAR